MVDIQRQVMEKTLEEVKSTTDGSDELTDVCVICLDTISEPTTAHPCEHNSFDFLCLLSWLQERAACPLCKAKICQVEYDQQHAQGAKLYHIPAAPHQAYSQSRSVTSAVRSRSPQFIRSQTPRPSNPVGTDAALLRRRDVYAKRLYSLHVGSNRLSRFQDIHPRLFVQDGELLSRARKWIRRELQVFEYLSADASLRDGTRRRASNAEFLLEYIVAILKTTDIKGSGGQAEDLLQDFLGRENTTLFLHELKAWLRSPYTNLQDWDRNVQYGRQAAVTSISKQAQSTQGSQRSSSGIAKQNRGGGGRLPIWRGVS